jgi:hypothetical protein
VVRVVGAAGEDFGLEVEFDRDELLPVIYQEIHFVAGGGAPEVHSGHAAAVDEYAMQFTQDCRLHHEAGSHALQHLVG